MSRTRIDVDLIVAIREALKPGNTVMTVTELAEVLSIPEATMYRNVVKLQAAGLIKPAGRKKFMKAAGPWARLWSWTA